MVLGFNKQFPSKILAETKIHTIREDKANRWKPGRKIHFATGVRTKNYNCFKRGECLSVQSIKIEVLLNEDSVNNYVFGGKIYRVKVCGAILSKKEIESLARNDGFDSTDAFFEWFSDEFEGSIIHWTDKRYLK